jgi:hypothetical protein
VQKHILNLFHPRGVPSVKHGAVAQQAADPIELGGIGVKPGRPEDLIEMNGLIRHSNDGAVFRRNIVEIVGRANAAGTRHVLRHDTWLAGEEPADMPGDQAAVGVVAAAWCGRDDDRQGLALEELIVRPSGVGHALCQQDGKSCNLERRAHMQWHGNRPVSATLLAAFRGGAQDGTSLVNQLVSSLRPIPRSCARRQMTSPVTANWYPSPM